MLAFSDFAVVCSRMCVELLVLSLSDAADQPTVSRCAFVISRLSSTGVTLRRSVIKLLRRYTLDQAEPRRASRHSTSTDYMMPYLSAQTICL